MQRLFLSAVLLAHTLAILTPVVKGVNRCFIVHTYTPDETIKLDLNFPRFNRRFKTEGFTVNITNTKTA